MSARLARTPAPERPELEALLARATDNPAADLDSPQRYGLEPVATSPDKRELAILAAAQASDSVAELLRYAREGDSLQSVFATDVIEQLLEAAKLAIDIEDDFNPERGQVYSAIRRYLEGWA